MLILLIAQSLVVPFQVFRLAGDDSLVSSYTFFLPGKGSEADDVVSPPARNNT